MSIVEKDLTAKIETLESILNALEGIISTNCTIDDYFDQTGEIDISRCRNKDSEIVWIKKNNELALVFTPEDTRNIIWYWCHPSYADEFNSKVNKDNENLFRWVGTDTVSDISTKVKQINNNEPTDGKCDLLLEFDEETLKKLEAASSSFSMSNEEFIIKVLQDMVKTED